MSHCFTSPVSLCPHCVLYVPHTSLEKRQEGLGEGNEKESSEHRRVKLLPTCSCLQLPIHHHAPFLISFNTVPHSIPCSVLALLLLLLLLMGRLPPLTRHVCPPQKLHPFTAGLRRASELLQRCIQELRNTDALAGTQVTGVAAPQVGDIPKVPICSEATATFHSSCPKLVITAPRLAAPGHGVVPCPLCSTRYPSCAG